MTFLRCDAGILGGGVLIDAFVSLGGTTELEVTLGRPSEPSCPFTLAWVRAPDGSVLIFDDMRKRHSSWGCETTCNSIVTFRNILYSPFHVFYKIRGNKEVLTLQTEGAPAAAEDDTQNQKPNIYHSFDYFNIIQALNWSVDRIHLLVILQILTEIARRKKKRVQIRDGLICYFFKLFLLSLLFIVILDIFIASTGFSWFSF